MPSIFTRIMNGEIPCEKIAENAGYFAFLDIRPINPGHTLVVPKLEVDELFEAPDDILLGVLPFAKPIASAIKEAVGCRRVGLLVAGFEVPHAHIHLVPVDGEGELSFDRAKPASPVQLAEMAAKIRSRLR
jgi:histidine triad (HIT) family protein